MTITLLVLALMMGVIVWWLISQTLNTTPWVATGVGEEVPIGEKLPRPEIKVALAVFLAVATSLFSLFISAYMMRMELGDWRPVSEPGLLWLNTGLLLLSSIALHRAQSAAKTENFASVKFNLLVAGVLTFAFLAGQLWAWQMLHGSGVGALSNPASAFFYVLTALHGLHLLGGLWVWGRTTVKVWSGKKAESVRMSIELCTIYWHYLLIVWLVLFGLLLYT